MQSTKLWLASVATVALTAGLLLPTVGGAQSSETVRAKRDESRATTKIVGWSTDRATLAPGQKVKDRVRVKTKGTKSTRKVVLQRAVAGTRDWTRVWQRSTKRSGKLLVKFTAPTSGSWKFRIRVRQDQDGQSARSAKRRVDIAVPSAADPTDTPSVPPDSSSPATQPGLIFVAGDIGLCGGAADQTAALIDPTAEAFVATGDLAYPSGTDSDFAACYDPHFGSLKSKTYPVAGNHEYYSGGAGYFNYFGSRVGTLAEPWYAVDIGGWRFFMLDSECSIVGCDTTSAQYAWLADQLSGELPQCTAAVWHRPRWSSGAWGSYADVSDLYELLYDHGTDLLLSGHEHAYERFAPLSPAGTSDPAGIRQFVVGTGGTTLRDFSSIETGSESRLSDSHGVLRMQLSGTGYDWDFLPTESAGGTDAGSALCR
jgi:hypothetical protein